jgi:beta-glucosidase
VQYDLGSDYADTVRFGGLWAAENSDITIAVIGLTPVLEGEEGDAFLAPHGGDKQDLAIPPAHVAFMRALRKRHNKPIVAVITAGSAIDVSSIEPYADAILLTWYPGEQGGNALADVLFGKASPAGRLPVTFYQSLKDLPSYDSYGMQGRTYRYFNGKVQYPFGYGLTYTTFDYKTASAPKKSYAVKDNLSVTVSIKNTGTLDSDEVVQAYIVYPQGERMPLKELKAFKRIHLAASQQKNVTLSIPMTDLQKWSLKKHAWELTKGDYKIYIGSNSQDQKLTHTFKVQ